MQINPFLMSLAAPAAARSVRAIAHAAHNVGQSFMATFADAAEAPAELAAEASQPLEGQLQSLAGRFRNWLRQNGVGGDYSLQFHVDASGEPVTNVTGRDSAQIIDMLYEGSAGWLEQMSELAQAAKQQLAGSSERLSLAITNSDAHFATRPTLAHSYRPTG